MSLPLITLVALLLTSPNLNSRLKASCTNFSVNSGLRNL